MKKIKNMSKKVKIILMMAIFTILTVPMLTFAADTPKLSLQMPETTERGEVIKAKLLLNNVDAMTAGGLVVKYDTSKFEFLEEECEDSTYALLHKVSVLYSLMGDKTGVRVGFAFTGVSSSKFATDFDGELLTLAFRVKSDATGKYDFKLELEEFTNDQTPIECKIESASTTVKVDATGFSVDNDNLVMLNGDTKKIQITVQPTGTTTPANISYSVDGSSVTVDTDGTIHANNNGDSTITVNAYGFQKTIKVKVINPIERIDFDTKSIDMEKNETKDIIATPVPHNPEAEATGSTTIKWTSTKEEVAEVNNGKVRAKTGGTTTIKAEIIENGVVIASNECNVKVVVSITKATIDTENLKLMIDNDAPSKAKHQLVVTVEPDDATDKKVTYESKDQKIATVSENGMVTAVGAGKTTIVAKVGTYTFNVAVQVVIPAKSIKFNDSKIEMLPNQTKKLEAIINPSNTSEISKIKWVSSANDVVEVDNDGNIKALQSGEAIITVSIENPEYGDPIEAKITVKVLKPIENVVITPSTEFKMNKGDTTTLGIDTYPKGDDVEKVTVSWSSSATNVVTVDKSGKVSAVGTGKAVVTGEVSNGKKVTANITVENPIKALSFKDKNLKIELGKEHKLDLNINPSDYYYSPAKEIKWVSNDTSIIEVANGVVKAKSAGTTTVTATIDGKTAKITIEVYIPIKGITIDGDWNGKLEKGTSNTLTAKINPSNTTENKEIKWTSSDPSIATVSEIGMVTGLKAGHVTITATASNGMKATKEVDVIVSIKKFVVASNEMTFYKGASNAKAISTIIEPSDTTENKKISWTSSDKTIATVSETGVVTGLKEGVTTITGTLENGMSVQVKVTVETIPLDDIEIKFDGEIYKGKTTTIVLNPVPVNSTELENVVFESSNLEVVKVDSEGNVTGLKAGEAVITIKVQDLVKEIKVVVKEVKAEKITAITTSNKIAVGDEMLIQVKVEPKDMTEELTYTYKSSDEKVLKVDEDGTIVGVKPGTATITVTASNGLTSTINITVTGAVVNPQTGLDSYIPYLVIAIVSLLSILTICYTKKRFMK